MFTDKPYCPICLKEMSPVYMIVYTDYECSRSSDHSLTYRIRDNIFIKIRVALRSKRENLHIKVHYDEGYSEVWTWADLPRVRINQVIPIDLSNLEKLRQKIRTLLLFS